LNFERNHKNNFKREKSVFGFLESLEQFSVPIYFFILREALFELLFHF